MLRVATFFCVVLACQSAGAAIALGLIDDFEDGTLGGWNPPAGNTANVAGGPIGSTRALRISPPVNRPAPKLSAFDAGPDITGAIDPAVTAIEVDMFRDAGASPLEIRLVLFGPGTGNRWTSTESQILPGDGLWNTYRFGILFDDLTQTAGTGSYADLTAHLVRIMFRHDAGAPSAQGTTVEPDIGSFFIDNVTAVPVPAALWLFAGALSTLGFGVRRRAT